MPCEEKLWCDLIWCVSFYQACSNPHAGFRDASAKALTTLVPLGLTEHRYADGRVSTLLLVGLEKVLGLGLGEAHLRCSQHTWSQGVPCLSWNFSHLKTSPCLQCLSVSYFTVMWLPCTPLVKVGSMIRLAVQKGVSRDGSSTEMSVRMPSTKCWNLRG